MKGVCGSCLDMRFAERPSHDVNWPWLVAVIKVYLVGMKAAAWKYFASLCLVVS